MPRSRLTTMFLAALAGCGPDVPTEWTIYGTPPEHTELALDVARDLAPCSDVGPWGGTITILDEPGICGPTPAAGLPADGCAWDYDDAPNIWIVSRPGMDASGTALLHELGHLVFDRCGLPHRDHPAAFWNWVASAHAELYRREQLSSSINPSTRSPTMPTLSEKFSTNLGRARAAKKLTQEQLAEKAGISVSYVSMLERGQRSPPLETLEQLAAALKVSPTALLA